MNITTALPDVRSYLEAVRAHLADIPERELEELVEDLEGHLLEVAAEEGGSLEDRLGPPEVYADELRATAGLQSRDHSDRTPVSRRLAKRFQRSALGRMIDAGWTSRSFRTLRTFLPELRPGWWVLRGYLAVSAAAIISYEGYYSNPAVPFAWGSYAVGIIAVLGAVLVSVALGRESKRKTGAARLSFLVNAVVVLLTLVAISRIGNLYVQTAYQTEYLTPRGLYHQDGTPIANICPYATDGKLILGVLLFDQDGRAISNTYDEFGTGQREPTIPNAYPRQLLVPDPNTGELFPLTCPPMLTGLPSPIPTPGGGN